MNKLPSIRIYSVFHKPAPLPKLPYVIPIQVGTALSAEKLDMLHDNDHADNISSRNKNYSELTACYWIWKHADRSGSDCWGLCHYRRYFCEDRYKFFRKKSRVYFKLNQEKLDSVVNATLYEQMQKLLSRHDLIVQKPVYAHREGSKRFTIRKAYEKAHHSFDWSVTMAVIQEKFPDYVPGLEHFNNQTVMPYYNMMVAPWAVWDGYLDWLFAILFEVEKRITISNDPYQARVFGFISERLLSLYIQHNQLKPAYMTVALFERS